MIVWSHSRPHLMDIWNLVIFHCSHTKAGLHFLMFYTQCSDYRCSLFIYMFSSSDYIGLFHCSTMPTLFVVPPVAPMGSPNGVTARASWNIRKKNKTRQAPVSIFSSCWSHSSCPEANTTRLCVFFFHFAVLRVCWTSAFSFSERPQEGGTSPYGALKIEKRKLVTWQ